MGTNNNSAKPWLDHRGRELPNEQLREISKNWDLKTWKQYGDSLEVQPEGKNLKPGEFRKIEERQTKSFFSVSTETTVSTALTNRVDKALECLSPKQREVIEHIFYNGKSLEGASLEMGVSKGTAQIHKRNGLAKLKGVLAVRSDAVAAYEGVSDLETESKTPFEELLDVMNEDISRDDSAKHDFDKGDRE